MNFVEIWECAICLIYLGDCSHPVQVNRVIFKCMYICTGLDVYL